MTPQELAAVQARIDGNPQIQALVQQYRNQRPGQSAIQIRAAIQRALQAMGITLPPDYGLSPDGKIRRQNFVERNAGTIFPAAVGGLAGGAALGAFGQGPGAASAGAASQALGMQGLPGAASSLGPGGAAGALAGGGAGAASAVGSAAGGAAFDPRNWQDWLGVGLTGAGLIGGAMNQPETPDLSPELRGLFNQQYQRFESQNPLYESVAQLAFNRLPTSATAGLPMPSLAASQAAVPDLQPGEFSEEDDLRRLLRQQQIRGHMGNSIFDAITRLAGQRMPGRRP